MKMKITVTAMTHLSTLQRPSYQNAHTRTQQQQQQLITKVTGLRSQQVVEATLPDSLVARQSSHVVCAETCTIIRRT